MELFQKMALRVISAAIIGGVGAAAAADLPKEGKYDFTSCSVSTVTSIEFSKTHSAASWESLGTNRSNLPGGFFDMTAVRCVGSGSTSDGKLWSGINVCQAVDKDGDKLLTKFIFEGPKSTVDMAVGTGKYEGITRTGGSESLGDFPTAKPGTFQSCTRNTGTSLLSGSLKVIFQHSAAT
jgi:hypothetical protein